MQISAKILGLFLLVQLTIGSQHLCADDWPQWRGTDGNNHAADGTQIPLRWSLTNDENIQWKVKLPGRGHSTPIVIGSGIYMTTAESETQEQSLLKVERNTGLIVDKWILHRGTLPARIHFNNSHASPSPASDGENIYVAFHTDDAIWATAVTLEGRIVWKKKVSAYQPNAFQFGYGASPILEDGLVIIAAEFDGKESGLYALDARTGNQVWKAKRPANLNFATPIVASITGQRQVLIAGADSISSYDPQTGRKLWNVNAGTEAHCGTAVWDGRRVIVSGGNPNAGTWCVSGDGTERAFWQKPVMCYEQSLLAIKNYVFAVSDAGVGYCWRTQDGKEMWKKRIFSGRLSASPLLVDNRIYLASERGVVYVIAAFPERFDLLAENPSGDSIFASPIAVDDRLYLRTGMEVDGRRQEFLIAIGEQ